MANLRAFIAVLLTADLRSRIGSIQERLKKVAPEVKWVAEENFHITMKFLGSVDENRVDSISDALAGAVTGTEPFSVTISGVGAFPNARRPRTIWVGVSAGAGQLAAVDDKVEPAMARLRFPKEPRRFSAHITIGRVRPDQKVDALSRALQSADIGELGVVDVAGVALMNSDLQPKGPVYSILKDIPFSPSQGDNS